MAVDVVVVSTWSCSMRSVFTVAAPRLVKEHKQDVSTGVFIDMVEAWLNTVKTEKLNK